MRKTRSKKRVQEFAPSSDTRDRLVALGAEVLADALLNLAETNKSASHVVERLARPERSMESLHQQFEEMCDPDDFIDWSRLMEFSVDFSLWLESVKTNIEDGHTGFELMVWLFERDQDVLEKCDDDGLIGDRFNDEAVQLLQYYGARCDDKDWLCEQLLQLYEQDQYGVRGNIFDGAAKYLPPAKVRHLIEQLEIRRLREPKDYEKSRWTSAIKSLTDQGEYV